MRGTVSERQRERDGGGGRERRCREKQRGKAREGGGDLKRSEEVGTGRRIDRGSHGKEVRGKRRKQIGKKMTDEKVE